MRTRAIFGGCALALGLSFAAIACGDGDETTGAGGAGGEGGTGAGGPGSTASSTGSAGGSGGAGAAGGGSSTGGAGGTGGGGGGATGLCTVQQGTGPGTLLKGTVLAPDEVLSPGQVLVDGAGKIACVAADCSAADGAAEATVVDCPDGVISPGLINPHDHITFANNPPKTHGQIRYDHRHDWRTGDYGKPKISVKGGASKAMVLFAELRFVMSGATSAASAGGQKGLLRNVDTSGLLEGLPIQPVDSDTFPLGDSGGDKKTSGCNYSTNQTTAKDIEDLDGYLPHIAEGIGEDARNEFLCLTKGTIDVVEPQTSIIHAIGMQAEDFNHVHGERAGVVWSPRSNVDLYGNTAAVTLIDRLGVPVALGTDWVASGSMNILRELACADELNQNYYGKHFDDAGLWRMVTTNAAIALGAQHAVGMLKPGLAADISIFDGSVKKAHRAVVGANVADVLLVMRGGKVLYGDADLVASPALGGPECEELEVCEAPRRACVQKDTGTSLKALLDEGTKIYPLFSCGTPENEPSCVPYREEYASGITASDKDGDGIPNGEDDCPEVFDPVRPVDKGKQSDMDGDGKGDACDACPLDATDKCTPRDSNDLDGDGVPNAFDNCLDLANADQKDTDKDGVGDACAPDPNDPDKDGVPNPTDNCPGAKNPGQEDADKDGKGDACDFDTTIKAIRDPSDPAHPDEGATVAITGAYVTAIRPDTGSSRGFYVQDPSLAPLTGIFVFTGSQAPTVKVGNRVSVTGTYDDFFGLAEIVSPTVTIDDAGTTLPFGPIAIPTPADVATGGKLAEGYESMLIEVQNVSIVTQNPDDPKDFDEFVVTGDLRVDDQVSDGVVGQGLDNVCAVGQTFSKIAGVLGYSFDNFKLQPRGASDVAGTCDPFVP